MSPGLITGLSVDLIFERVNWMATTLPKSYLAFQLAWGKENKNELNLPTSQTLPNLFVKAQSILTRRSSPLESTDTRRSKETDDTMI